MAQFFEKKQENPYFGPLCRNINLSLKRSTLNFSRLKILNHMQKKFWEKFLTDRHMDKQYTI